jgi:hypothetical protein
MPDEKIKPPDNQQTPHEISLHNEQSSSLQQTEINNVTSSSTAATNNISEKESATIFDHVSSQIRQTADNKSSPKTDSKPSRSGIDDEGNAVLDRIEQLRLDVHQAIKKNQNLNKS